MQIAEDFNLYLTEQAPWKLGPEQAERARQVCSAGVYASQVIAGILAPVLPRWAEKVERMLKLPHRLDFAHAGTPLGAGHVIGEYEILAEPIDPAKVAAIIEASKETTPVTIADTPAYEVEALQPETTIDAFGAIDLRVAKVLACAKVEGADKLLQLTLDVGPLGQRNVFSGIAKSYAPEQLVGKHVVLFANLKPRKMRFGLSEGMILASGSTDDAVTVLELDGRSRPGERVS